MRDMALGERHSWYVKGQWPCCGGSEYLRGPSGGICTNIECPSCGMRVNVLDPDIGVGQFRRDHLPTGQVISAPTSYVAPPDPNPMINQLVSLWSRFIVRFKCFLKSEVN
jgi:hypothetical protein